MTFETIERGERAVIYLVNLSFHTGTAIGYQGRVRSPIHEIIRSLGSSAAQQPGMSDQMMIRLTGEQRSIHENQGCPHQSAFPDRVAQQGPGNGMVFQPMLL
jgi:hypothetical protein